MAMKVGLIFDKSRLAVRNSTESAKEDSQKEKTRDRIRDILRRRFDVIDMEADEKLPVNLMEKKIDIAFNLSTGIRGESRQSQVPALLEMMGIPYLGSGVLAHSLALNKSMAKKVFKFHGVRTPDFKVVYRKTGGVIGKLTPPLIAKPSCEGSGIGIYKDSVVRNDEELAVKVQELLSRYRQPVLVEEFIDGREFTVGVMGNEPDIRVLPPMEIDFSGLPEEYGRFNTFEAKSKYWELVKYCCPAKIDRVLLAGLEDAAVEAYRALGCRDFARVDIRVRDGKPYVLEINTLPGLQEGYSDFPAMAGAAGIKYPDLINELMEVALKRYNI